jgi:Cyanate lyase C-terminal domain
VQVYGTTGKELIREEFGDGIMSAIDFDRTMERQPEGRPCEDRHVGQVPGVQDLPISRASGLAQFKSAFDLLKPGS